MGRVTPDDARLSWIAAHGLCRHSPDWIGATWWQGFLEPLLTAGYFLPPLFAFDLLSTVLEGSCEPGSYLPQDGYRERRAFWDALGVRLRAARRADSVAAEHDLEAPLRLARRLAQRLMAVLEVKEFRCGAGPGLDAGLVLTAEAERLKGPQPPGVLDAAWDLIFPAITPPNIDLLLPLEAPYEAWLDYPLDPFLAPLLGCDGHPEAHPARDLALLPGATIEKVHRPGNAGAFDRQRPGRLPSDPARLAPMDLALLTKPSLRYWFFHKVSTGTLEQRFYRVTHDAKRRPRVHLQCLIAQSDPSLFRLQDGGRTPAISWYRATAIALLSELAAYAKHADWHLTVELATLGPAGEAAVRLRPRDLGSAAAGALEVLRLLFGTCPWAFAFVPGVDGPRAGARAAWWVPEVDHLAQVAFGPSAPYTRPLEVRGTHETRLRVLRSDNGRWRWVREASHDGRFAHPIPGVGMGACRPLAAAGRLLVELLGHGPRGPAGPAPRLEFL